MNREQYHYEREINRNSGNAESVGYLDCNYCRDDEMTNKLGLTDIAQEIYNGSKNLAKGSAELFNLAKEMAEADREYTIELGKEKLKLRDEGMAVGLIKDVAEGNVADLRFKKMLADARYTAGRERSKSLAAQLSALQSILRIQSEV